jgi:hypothetical protein
MHALLTSALGEGERQFHDPSTLTPIRSEQEAE